MASVVFFGTEIDSFRGMDRISGAEKNCGGAKTWPDSPFNDGQSQQWGGIEYVTGTVKAGMGRHMESGQH